MNQELLNFISSSIASGVVGNIAYDGLKLILGTSFNKLSSYLQEDKNEKFEGYVELLLENITLKEQFD